MIGRDIFYLADYLQDGTLYCKSTDPFWMNCVTSPLLYQQFVQFVNNPITLKGLSNCNTKMHTRTAQIIAGINLGIKICMLQFEMKTFRQNLVNLQSI